MITGSARTMMQNVQERSMQHVCSIEPYIVAEDGTISYGTAFESKCGFQLVSGNLSEGSMYDTVAATAKLRLPVGVPIGMHDRVTVTAAYGETVVTRTFKVTSLPGSFGPSGQVADLQEIWL